MISGASNSERGVALLGAVLLAAIVTVLAVAWLDRLDVFVGRASGVLEELQAADHVASMEAWAVVVLRRDGAGATVDHRNEVWARPSTTLSVPGGQARGSLSDLQGRFNLNALVIGGEPNAAAIVFFKALLRRLDLSNVRVEAIIDWLDPDTIALPGGGEDVLYLRAEPSYRAANGPMAPLHDRLPLVIGPEDFGLWLGEAGHGAAALMHPPEDGFYAHHPVSRLINKGGRAAPDGPELQLATEPGAPAPPQAPGTDAGTDAAPRLL